MFQIRPDDQRYHGSLNATTDLFLERVGVVETEDEFSLVLVGQESVENRRLQVTNVQVSRRFRGYNQSNASQGQSQPIRTETNDDFADGSVRQNDLDAFGPFLFLRLFHLRTGLVERLDGFFGGGKRIDMGPPSGEMRTSWLLDRSEGGHVCCASATNRAPQNHIHLIEPQMTQSPKPYLGPAKKVLYAK